LYGITESGGFIQLTGEVGTGKTTIVRSLLERMPGHADVAVILNPLLSPIELLEAIARELHIPLRGRLGQHKRLVDALNQYLLQAYADGLRVVLIIDEAQDLSPAALEQVRLLTNLETSTQKLLQILLLGQPELRAMLARPELRQLAQRITARYHLTPLDAKETGEYLRHRWRVAGGHKFPFEAKAVQRMHQRAGGVPRLLNVIAERALLAGYARDVAAIDAKLVDAAADEVLPPAARQARWPWLAAAAAIAALALIAMQWRTAPPAPEPAVAVASPAAAASPAPAATPVTPRTETLDAAALAQLVGATGDTPVPGWQALLAAWRLPAASITVDPAGPCTAVQADVHCVQGRASLTTLLALDRPQLLRLQAGSARAWALLLGADARDVRLRVGTRTFDLDRVLLQSWWNGDHAGLWRGPAMLAVSPRPGQAGPAVDWLRQELSPTANVVPGIPYDATLRAQVTPLQDARGLPADGIAGPLTLMALADDPPGPRLLRVLD
jgi:general secretion pathway protein A